MEIGNSLLTQSVNQPQILPDIRSINESSDEKKKQFAMEFESLIIGKLLDEAASSIASINEDEDGAKGQVQNIFNMFLSRHIGASGGLGLCKDIYKSLNQLDDSVTNAQEFDKQI